MAKPPLLTPEELRQLLRYEPETGKLYWRARPRGMFPTTRSWASWNTKYAEREALPLKPSGYCEGFVLGRSFKAHRVIWAIVYGKWPEGQVDHINHDRKDNRLPNLRVVTNLENQRNATRQRNNTSGITGVIWNKRLRQWIARIGDGGPEYRHLGTFKHKRDAIAARKAAERDLGFHRNHGRPKI